MIQKLPIIFVSLLLLSLCPLAQAQTRVRTLVVQTAPNATVWIDDVKRGVADDTGRLEIKPVQSSAKFIRIRAVGFKEVVKPLVSAGKTVNIVLVKTTDAAEVAFQEAEERVSEDHQNAVELYQKAIKLNPRFAPAFVGLARALTGSDNEAALTMIGKARKLRAVYPEASAVEGRIFRAEGDSDKAIDSFERAVREGSGFQPEAFTGLGLIFKGEAEDAAAAGDFDDEKYYYDEAAKAFEKAIDQLSSTEPVLYYLLGDVYEKLESRQKAIAVYERFLRDFPDSEERSAIQSFIVQLRKEMSGKQ